MVHMIIRVKPRAQFFSTKPSCATTESTLFAVSKVEWKVNEECIVCTAVCQKAPLRPEQHPTKCIALVIVELCWSEGIRWAVI